MNEGFLVVTSSQKIKSHVAESQITSLVWPCLSLTEKQNTVNRMIIFNDSVSKFYQSAFEISFSSRRMLRLLPRQICVFQYLPRPKKNAESIKFLGILKKYVSKNEIYFCLKNKSNTLFNKKGIFVFHTIFKLVFITQIIYCIIHRCRCPLFVLFLFSYQFLKSGTQKQC